MTLLLKNGIGLIDHKLQTLTVLIANNRIQELNGSTAEADEVIELHQDFISPGLIDLHVHLREPGFTNKETVKTGGDGGFTWGLHDNWSDGKSESNSRY